MSKETIETIVNEHVLTKMDAPVNVDKAIGKLLLKPEQQEAYKIHGAYAFLEPEQTGKGDKTIIAIQALQTLLGRDLTFPEALSSISKIQAGKILTVVDGEIIETNLA